MKKHSGKDSLKDTRSVVLKGAVVNFLGTIGSVMMPVFFIYANRAYSPARTGIFLLAFTIVDIFVNLTINGIGDGLIMIASRHIDQKEEEHEVYDVLANSFLLVFLLSGIVIFFSRFGGDVLVRSFYDDAELLPTLQLMLLSLPFVGIIRMVIASTHAMVIMKWDALSWNFLRPVLLLTFAVLFSGQKNSALALGRAFFLTNLILAAGLLVVFGIYFSYRKLFRHILHFKLNRELIRFAAPQNLNMTFNKFITDLDLIMLGYFQFDPALISFYGMGSQLVRNIRKVKAAFAGIYAPIISRIRAAGDTRAMNRTFSMIASWTTMIALPLSVLIIVFRNELLSIFHSSFGSGVTILVGGVFPDFSFLLATTSVFMVILVLVPLLDCVFGMAGNIIVMSGHSGWNLFNSIVIASLNVGLNYLFIPAWGLIGAALASVIATFFVMALQLIEVNWLLSVKMMPGRLYKPFLAVLPALVLLLIGTAGSFSGTILIRLVLVLVGLALYALLLWLLKPEGRSSLDLPDSEKT